MRLRLQLQLRIDVVSQAGDFSTSCFTIQGVLGEQGTLLRSSPFRRMLQGIIAGVRQCRARNRHPPLVRYSAIPCRPNGASDAGFGFSNCWVGHLSSPIASVHKAVGASALQKHCSATEVKTTCYEPGTTIYPRVEGRTIHGSCEAPRSRIISSLQELGGEVISRYLRHAIHPDGIQLS